MSICCGTRYACSNWRQRRERERLSPSLHLLQGSGGNSSALKKQFSLPICVPFPAHKRVCDGGLSVLLGGNKYPRGAVAKAPEVGPNATSTPAEGAAWWARISTFRAGQLLLVLFRASLELQQPNSASDSLPVSSVMWLGQHRPSQRASFFMIPGHPSACHVEMAHNWTWSTSGQLQRGEIPTRGLAGNPASAETKRRAYHSSIPPALLCLPDPWVLIRISSCSQMQKVRESFLQGHSYHRSYKWLQWHQLLSLTVLLCQARQR